MTGSAKTFLLILAIPLLLAVSHDVYLNYFSDKEKRAAVERLDIDPNKFQMTEVGWVWTEYSKSTFDIMRDSVSEETWKKTVSPILNMKTIYAMIWPIGIGALYCLIAWLLSIWPFQNLGRFSSLSGKKKMPSLHDKSKAKPVKYGRK